MATAAGLSALRLAVAIWPLTVAAALPTAVTGTGTPLDGPPVITGTPVRFCQFFDPSWSDAKTA